MNSILKYVKVTYYQLLAFRQTLFGIFLFKKPKYNKKYNLSVCGIFKNEAKFLKEWIDYHRLIGVEHFYLYNNNSTDEYKEILSSYVKADIVTCIDWPYAQGQMSAYKHFHENYWEDSQWVTFLDIDEFYVPKKDLSLLEWIKKHDKNPVNLVYWKMFGSSGILKHDDLKTVIEQYTISWPALVRCGKCIINTDYQIQTFDATTHHRTRVNNKKSRFTIYPINQFGKIIIQEQEQLINKRASDSSDIQINHYWSKGWDIYKAKKEMEGDVYFKNNPKNNIAYFLKHEIRNSDSDFSIQRFLLPLKWIQSHDSIVKEINSFFENAKL